MSNMEYYRNSRDARRVTRGGAAQQSSPASRPLNRQHQRSMPQHKTSRASISHLPYDPYEVPDDDVFDQYEPSDVKMKFETSPPPSFPVEESEQDQRLTEFMNQMGNALRNFEKQMPPALHASVKKAVAESNRDVMMKLEAMEAVLQKPVAGGKHSDTSSQTKKFQDMSKQLQEMLERNTEETTKMLQEALAKASDDSTGMSDFLNSLS